MSENDDKNPMLLEHDISNTHAKDQQSNNRSSQQSSSAGSATTNRVAYEMIDRSGTENRISTDNDSVKRKVPKAFITSVQNNVKILHEVHNLIF